jgi:hypothetical protein
MAAPKYIEHDTTSGNLKEVIATETGPSAEVIVSTGTGGIIDASLLPASEAATAVAGENLSAGQYVYIKAADGKLYKAVWSAGGVQAIGFVLASFPSAATATYYDGGQNTSVSGLTAGVRYYGDPSTAGGVTLTVPTGAGVLAQFLGYAASTTAIASDICDAVILAS